MNLSTYTNLGLPPTPTGLWDTALACDNSRARGRLPGVVVALADPKERIEVLTGVAVAAAASGASVIVATQTSEPRIMLPSQAEQQACQAMLAAADAAAANAAQRSPLQPRPTETASTVLVLPSLALAALPTMRKILDRLPHAPGMYLCVGVDPVDPADAYVLCQPDDVTAVRTASGLFVQTVVHDEIVRSATGG